MRNDSHLPIPHDLTGEPPEQRGAHEDFDDEVFEETWREEVEAIASRLKEIAAEMELEFNRCGDECDHLDEYSHMYNSVRWCIDEHLSSYIKEDK